LGMFGRMYPSTRITNNRLDCVIEHRTLPTTTTHYYYPLLLPTTTTHYPRTSDLTVSTYISLSVSRQTSAAFFLSTLGFFGIHDHWPSLVFIVIGTINIGHHWHQYHWTSLYSSTWDIKPPRLCHRASDIIGLIYALPTFHPTP
jgi:hypothetical protein